MDTFGTLFRVHIFGESHGECVGAVLDGVPPGLALNVEDFLPDLARRNPANLAGTTPRKESDIPHIKTGVFRGFTTGAPLTVLFYNRDVDSSKYEYLRATPRPGSADLTAKQKYCGFNDYRGGGHFSGRLTVSLVAAGVVAKKIVPEIRFCSEVVSAGGSKDVEKEVLRALEEGDSIGGVVECRAKGVPVGLGEPFFNSVESVISHILFSIPAVKAVEFGEGIKGAASRGSEFNDPIVSVKGAKATNNSGGIEGGISDGSDIHLKVYIKPPASIAKEQRTINLDTGKCVDVSVKGRHDACIALRAPVVVEASVAVALADLYLVKKAYERE
ncbi:MAG: chorismate synthase [Candidatus Dadabacteria bacterium]|nr:MAG: chorismate synthase [Candidatus Dadabacteria bacterium]